MRLYIAGNIRAEWTGPFAWLSGARNRLISYTEVGDHAKYEVGFWLAPERERGK